MSLKVYTTRWGKSSAIGDCTSCWIDCSHEADDIHSVYVACSLRFPRGSVSSVKRLWNTTFPSLKLPEKLFYAPMSTALVFSNAERKTDPSLGYNSLRHFNPFHPTLVLTTSHVSAWARAWVAHWKCLYNACESHAQSFNSGLADLFVALSRNLDGADPLDIHHCSPAVLAARALPFFTLSTALTESEFNDLPVDTQQALGALCAFLRIWRACFTVVPSLARLGAMADTGSLLSFKAALTINDMPAYRGELESLLLAIHDRCEPRPDDKRERAVLEDVLAWCDANQGIQTLLRVAANRFQMNLMGMLVFSYPL